MAPSEQTIRQAFAHADGRCECNLFACGHAGRCREKLDWEQRGVDWDVQPLDAEEEQNSLGYLLVCADCLGTWRQ